MKTILVLPVLAGLLFACQRVSLDTDNSSILGVDTKVYLSVDKTRYQNSDLIQISLRNEEGEPVFLEGCSQFYLESKADSGWAAQPLIVCVWEGYAVKVAPAEQFQRSVSAQNLHGTYRVSAPAHFGCQLDKPISEADCGRRTVVFSQEFVVE